MFLVSPIKERAFERKDPSYFSLDSPFLNLRKGGGARFIQKKLNSAKVKKKDNLKKNLNCEMAHLCNISLEIKLVDEGF